MLKWSIKETVHDSRHDVDRLSYFMFLLGGTHIGVTERAKRYK